MSRFDKPLAELIFTQREALKLTNVDTVTLGNWLRYDHIQPRRGRGGTRLFSFADLVQIDLIELLATLFEMKPTVGRTIAEAALRWWLPGHEGDLAHSPSAQLATERDDFHFVAFREMTGGVRGDLREVRGGDDPAKTVHVILPVGDVARRILGRIVAEKKTTGAAE